MADEQTTGQNPWQLPPGMRLIDEERYRTWAEAANDLKRLKSQIPEGLDLSKLPELTEELDQLRQERANETERAKKQLEELSKTHAEREKELENYKLENKRLRINSHVSTIIAQKSAEGAFLAQEFIPKDELYKLNPDAVDFQEKVSEILGRAYDRQQEVLTKIGGKISPLGPVVGSGLPTRQSRGGTPDSSAEALSILGQNRLLMWRGKK